MGSRELLQSHEGRGRVAGAGATQGAGHRVVHNENSGQLPTLLCWGQADF